MKRLQGCLFGIFGAILFGIPVSQAVCMTKPVIVLLYLSFAALGIPGVLLGAAWPALQSDTSLPYGYLGILQMLFAGLPILSSYLSGIFMRRYGISRDLILGMSLTAAAIFVFSFSSSLVTIAFASSFLGFGYGVLNTGLNTFAAQQYGAHHMNWLHSFWGIGAMGGPLLISVALSGGYSWRVGFQAGGAIQVLLILCLILSLPLWERLEKTIVMKEGSGKEEFSLSAYLRMKESVPMILMFFLFGGVEACFALWGASYLYLSQGMSAAESATWLSVFFVSVTASRMLTGFVSLRFPDRTIITGGIALILTGLILMILPLSRSFTLCGVLLIGGGVAPVFPTMVHSVPRRFSSAHSGYIMGILLTGASLGNMLLPFLFSLIAGVHESERMFLLPFYMLFNLFLFVLSFATLHRQRVTTRE